MNIPEMTLRELAAATADFSHVRSDDMIGIARAILAARDAQYAAMAGQEPVEGFTLDDLADACFAAEIPDSKYESLCLELSSVAHPTPTNPAAQERAEPVAPAVGEVSTAAAKELWHCFCRLTNLRIGHHVMSVADRPDADQWLCIQFNSFVEAECMRKALKRWHETARAQYWPDAGIAIASPATPPAPAQPAQWVDCTRCGNTGWVGDKTRVRCASCKGEGRLPIAQPSPNPSKPEQAAPTGFAWVLVNGQHMLARMDATANPTIAYAESKPEQAEAPSTLPPEFFAFSDDLGFETFRTEAEARECAENEIAQYRESAAGDEWPSEVESVRYGVVLGRSTEQIIHVDEQDEEDCADYQLTTTLPPASAAGDSVAGERKIQQWEDRVQPHYPHSDPRTWEASGLFGTVERSMLDEIKELRAALATKPQAEQEAAELPPLYMLAKLQMVMPLFQEARDALTAITEAQRKLHGISSSLDVRMDEAGTFSIDDWNAARTRGDEVGKSPASNSGGVAS